VRLRLTVGRVSPPGAVATLDVVAAGSSEPTPVSLGLLRRPGPVVLTGALPGHRTALQDVDIAPPPGAAQTSTAVAGAVTLRGISVRRHGAWHALAGVLGPARWRPGSALAGSVAASAGGLRWSFTAPHGSSAVLRLHDRPDPLPAVIATGLSTGQPRVDVGGLDGATLQVRPAATVPSIPGAPADGAVVDLDYAQRASFGIATAATAQVWVTGDPAPIRQRLQHAGVTVLSTASSADLAAGYSRQGPGLASVLFLTDAAAAALLAALAAIVGLAVAARRRRYEYAALATAGVAPRTLFGALAVEQAAVVGYGTVIGLLAGALAATLADRAVPEFVTAPAGIPLHYAPSVPVLAATLGTALVLLLATAVGAAAVLLRSLGADRLRAGPA
jgi:hypothetical protein